ncbi:MAG: RCC1 repeat-containing protein, partial [Candidatus Microthrix subdominans]
MRVRLFAVVLATAFLVVGCTGQPPAGPVVGISAGGNHTCVVRGNGTVACWGDNAAGWLGDGTTTGSSVPVGVVGITDAIAVTNSDYQSCALHADGRVSCWGFNGQGQLGNGTTTASSVPVPVTGVTNATAVAIGNTHSCALLADGGVSCWGYNVNGELGNGTTVPLSTVPVPVTGITNATALAANAFHSCAVLADGGVECWGGNNYGQLGNGTSLQSNVPVAVTGLTDATDLAVGYYHSCAIVGGGGAACWGQGGYGQLGDGVRPSFALVPVAVSGITDATALIAGDRHTCAILGNGDMSCWGSNWFGQLGNGTNDESI